MTRSPWGREYARTPGTYIWGTEASPLAREVSALLPAGARVLDLGCGEGRESVFFAERGFDVTGVDISRAGLAKAERLARERGVGVRWVHADVTRLVVDGPFDLVYSCGAVHYVPRRVRRRLFPRLKALTRPAGLHAHTVFTDRVVYVEKGERIDYFTPGELQECYRDWTALRHAKPLIDCAQDGTPHRHSVEELVVRAR
jgi:tellurite methyltransferase